MGSLTQSTKPTSHLRYHLRELRTLVALLKPNLGLCNCKDSAYLCRYILSHCGNPDCPKFARRIERLLTR